MSHPLTEDQLLELALKRHFEYEISHSPSVTTKRRGHTTSSSVASGGGGVDPPQLPAASVLSLPPSNVTETFPIQGVHGATTPPSNRHGPSSSSATMAKGRAELLAIRFATALHSPRRRGTQSPPKTPPTVPPAAPVALESNTAPKIDSSDVNPSLPDDPERESNLKKRLVELESQAEEAKEFQKLMDDSRKKRFDDVRAAARRDLEACQERIVTLENELAAREHESAACRDGLRNVQMVAHEEILKLRHHIVHLMDVARTWQEKEGQATENVRALEHLLNEVRREKKYMNVSDKRKDLEERLAAAILQKRFVQQELEEMQKLFAHQEHFESQFGSQHSQESSSWVARGKIADTAQKLRQKEETINGLTKLLQTVNAEDAISGVPSVAGKSEMKTMQKCPGCGLPQWGTPFCPQSGQKHLGFQSGLAEYNNKGFPHGGDGSSASPLRPSPQPAGTHVLSLENEVRKLDQEKVQLVSENGELRKLLKAMRNEVKKLQEALVNQQKTVQMVTDPNPVTHHTPSKLGGVAGEPSDGIVRLFDLPIEGESTDSRVNRLEQQNRQLSMRCTELLLEVTEKDRAIEYLKQQVHNAAVGHLESRHHEVPMAAAKEYHFQQEIAHLREEVMRQQLNSLHAQEELLRLRESMLRK